MLPHRTRLLITAAIVAQAFPLLLHAQGASRPPLPAGLEATRAALDKYADPTAAIRDGYLSTLVCMDFPAAAGAGHLPYRAGAMGVHFLNASTIGATVDSLRPQVLIYEPVGDRLQLVGAEWFVPVQLSNTRPTLWGHPFDGPMEGHQSIMPAALHHWDLHVWLWKQNPAGVFSGTNPAVKCPASPYTVHDQAPIPLAEP